MALVDRTMMAQIFRIVMPPSTKKSPADASSVSTDTTNDGNDSAVVTPETNSSRGRLDLRRNIHMTQVCSLTKCLAAKSALIISTLQQGG